MNFIQHSTSFKLFNKKLTKRPENIVPPVIQNQEEPDIELVQLDANMREEWMILSDLRTSFDNSSDETSSSSNYWHRDRATYSEQQIDEMPTWVKTKKE
ncbi:unnamed protein product [Pocillopora meandrina]|uniref:Uncharacterized protein n=1 Tax=Pocillopora meandrina TaxID=46732 RepID=A0AAU9WKM0_9CNID|nr:unnamed protein product [Pocillopora meandrina]